MNKQRMKLLCMDMIFVAALTAFDQFTKYLAVIHLKGQEPFPLIKGVLELQYLENRGSAFGILQGKTFFLLAVGILFMALIFFFLIRLPLDKKYSVFHLLASGIIAGGLGNLIDRIRFGYVIDFISFILIHYPVFNVADSIVVLSTIGIVVVILFVFKEEDMEKIFSLKSRASAAENKSSDENGKKEGQ